MRGYCTEMMAVEVAERLRDHGFDDENVNDVVDFIFMLQEDDTFLSNSIETNGPI